MSHIACKFLLQQRVFLQIAIGTAVVSLRIWFLDDQETVLLYTACLLSIFIYLFLLSYIHSVFDTTRLTILFFLTYFYTIFNT